MIKRMHRLTETVVLAILTFFLGIVPFLILKNILYLLILAPALQTALILIYRCAVRGRIENALARTIYEPTQMDCYICEDESEETDG